MQVNAVSTIPQEDNPMATKILNIPDGSSMGLHVGDELKIKVTRTCNWCYEYPDTVFSSMLAAGSYTATNPPTEYGPYTAANAGVMNWNAVTSGPCTTATPAATPRSITVS